MSDPECEVQKTCDGNSACFKGLLSSWMAFTTTLVDGKADEILPKIQTSAVAAAKQCSGGADGKICGQRWYQPTWDGSSGIGEQMSALSVLSSSLVVEKEAAPKSSNTGGTSKSDPNAGHSHDDGGQKQPELTEITTKDRIGAGVVTGAFLSAWIAAITWMVR